MAYSFNVCSLQASNGKLCVKTFEKNPTFILETPDLVTESVNYVQRVLNYPYT